MKTFAECFDKIGLGCNLVTLRLLKQDGIQELLREVWNQAIESAGVVAANTEEQGDYTGRDDSGGSYWESSAEKTRDAIVHKIEKLKSNHGD